MMLRGDEKMTSARSDNALLQIIDPLEQSSRQTALSWHFPQIRGMHVRSTTTIHYLTKI